MESQKETIERLLKQKNKKKRELAAYMGITENSVNRMLRNKNIAMSKLRKIAEFLEVDFMDILSRETLIDSADSFYLQPHTVIVSEDVVEKLADALLAGNRTNESQSRTIESLVKILEKRND
ncbi:helix-turn-helix transcriptional regulator [Bacteroidales bacterium OttesenSCG-928-A17]|nr:helix-turn-helix transcriptional regulator [Bacteroidales bacterium OttesenSCG-928-A17]